MHRFTLFWLMILTLALAGAVTAVVTAQSTQPEPGDPPVAALISVSEPDENGIVTIVGAQGSVFPTAQIAVRNLFTQETVYTSAGFTGSFSAQLYGPGRTPFLISPAQSIPTNLRDRPEALPGGPATIVYGTNPVPRRAGGDVTTLLIDGKIDDWAAYPQADLGDGLRALANTQSLYLGLSEPIPDDAQLVLVIILDDVTYELTLDPFVQQAALLRQIAPVERDPVALAVAAVTTPDAEQIEMRINVDALSADIETAIVAQTFLRVEDEEEPLNVNTRDAELPIFDEVDGIVYTQEPLSGEIPRFYVAGPIAQGASYWWASGRMNTRTLSTGETVIIEMDFTLRVPELSDSLTGLDLIGELALQPVTVGADGTQNVAALHTNNGWSNLLTATGLAIDNVRGDVQVARAVVPAAQTIRRGDDLIAGMRFEFELPNNLPPGYYVPTFTGAAQINDGTPFLWTGNGILGNGEGIARLPITRIPQVLTIGGVEEGRLAWTILYNEASEGSRGILSEEDTGQIGLSNRVRYNSPTYILPPGEYSIEPYLLNQLPNAYDVTATPLLPLLFPGGRVVATITLPDGDVDDLPDVSIAQSRISTAVVDERDTFGAQSPLDVFQLGTANPSYESYDFLQYGTYGINLRGSVDDVTGNRYQGGGNYTLLIAEPLDLTPGVLSGTPFFIGDTFFLGGRIAPSFPADVTIDVTVRSLDGETETATFDGTADDNGYFLLDAAGFTFENAGEYIIDYEARYTDDEGRLWAASLRSAGIVASETRNLIAHGERGLNGFVDSYRPAWFNTAVYPPLESLSDQPPRPNYPYFSGDVAFIPDRTDSGLYTVMHVQDTRGAYRNWLQGVIPDYTAPFGYSLQQLAASGELPLSPLLGGVLSAYEPSLLPDFIVNNSYAYISAVRPGVTVRQLVSGQADAVLSLYWDNDDPLNEQIGAGVNGNLPGDYIFLFGGAVVRNADAGVRQAAPYAALAVVTDPDADAIVAPPLRGRSNAALDPLISIAGRDLDAFFHPTGLRPGQILPQGATVSIAGQAAPTVQADVNAIITAPDGSTRQVNGRTNPLGYFYDPTQDFVVEQAGIWTATITTTPIGRAAHGTLDAPAPIGTILGPSETFVFYVESGAPVSWSFNGNVDVAYSPAAAFNITMEVPADWTDTTAHYTLATPGYVLQSDEMPIFSTSATYQYNPFAFVDQFPLEISGAGDGPSGSDVLILTVAIAGTDADGRAATVTRHLFVFHDRLLSVDALAEDSDD